MTLEHCVRMLDAAAQSRTALLDARQVDQCRQVARDLRRRGLAGGALCIEDRLRLLGTPHDRLTTPPRRAVDPSADSD